MSLLDNHWLAGPRDRLRTDTIQRFDPRFWTVNFPRPMMAAVTSTGPDSLTVDLSFYEAGNLAGLIWESADTLDHPLTGYETRRDYRGLTWSFRWRSSGAMLALNSVNGPTLTIEGRDATGATRTWYVRLWNYAQGSPTDARISLDFSKLDGGYALPADADRVWAGDIDRLFISMVPSGFVPGAATPLANAPLTAKVILSDSLTDGAGAVLAIGDAMTPPHSLRMAGGYDDQYNQTPARILRNCQQLGYRGWINHYVGMSHYYRLAWNTAEARWIVNTAAPVLDGPCAAWHSDFLKLAHALDYQVILSLSFELFNAHAPLAWRQQDHQGAPALTGWSPPSTLISPCSTTAVAYLKAVAAAFVALYPAGAARWFQIGEPWWWTGIGSSRKPHIYDPATTAAYTAATGLAVPPALTSFTANATSAQLAYVDWCAGKLAEATFALRDQVRTSAPGAKVLILLYTPQITDPVSTLPARLNVPAAWARPAFDVLQLEDYEHVTEEAWALHRSGLDAVGAKLAYLVGESHYFAGFVASAAEQDDWRPISQAITDARQRGFNQTFIWAYPQVCRDGFSFSQNEEEDGLTGFHDVSFPLEIGYGSSGGPEYSTNIITTASGHEQRLINWAQARMRYDVGLGVRSEADLHLVLRFFHARLGRAYGFRFRDPLDHASNDGAAPVTPLDQRLGTGNGTATDFPLVKDYSDGTGAPPRRILLPVAGTLRVAVGGAELISGWSWSAEEKLLRFTNAPATGAAITAGYLFDVPVRFDQDRLEVDMETFRASQLVSIPLIEVPIETL